MKIRGVFAAFLIGLILIILLAGLILAAAGHTNAPTSFSVLRNEYKIYNITITNANAADENITQINITLPSSFSFVTGSNNLSGNNSMIYAAFSNTTTVLSWTNFTFPLMNRTLNNISFFSINATASTAGYYNFTITTLNGTVRTLTNISIEVNASFRFNGTVYDNNRVALNYSNVSVLIKDSSFSQITKVSSPSNSSGLFYMILNSNSGYMYQLSIIQKNSSTNAVQWVGQTLPLFPYTEFANLADGKKYYLKPAGTINITVLNKSNDLTSGFAIQVKDTKLGYPVSSCSALGVEQICYVQKNRNYSIMVYPSSGGTEKFVPVSFSWNNFSSTTNYTITDNVGNNLSKFNATTITLHKMFNVTESYARISGYMKNASGGNISIRTNGNFTIVPFLLEPGNMIFMTYGTMPKNASGWNSAEGTNSDMYNLASGYYNITLPYAAAETVNYMLFAAAENNSFMGGFKNITVSGNAQHNITLYELLGSNAIINMSTSSGGSYSVNTKRQIINLVNSTTNATLSSLSAHIELDLDYSSYGSGQFTFMDDLSGQGTANFSFPMLNITGFKELNVYSQTFAPKRVSSRNAGQIITNNNVSMAFFNPAALNGSFSQTINITAYTSNSSCDVPSPPVDCILDSFTPTNMMNMLSLVVGGSPLSLRMRYGDVTVHYVNVDLLASGPPDSDFDSAQTEASSSGAGFNSVMKFGSSGPTIYDYVMVAMPYTPGNSTQVGLDSAKEINASIPALYDEDWNTPIWNVSTNGSVGTALGANYSHYTTYQTDWWILLNANNSCLKSTDGLQPLNSSTSCIAQTTEHQIWLRLPHLSGTSPSINAKSNTIWSSSSTSSASGGSGGGRSGGWTTYNYNDAELSEKGSVAVDLGKKEQISIKINGEDHHVGVVSVDFNKATINVSSVSQQATLNIGESKKFEVTGDNYYDLEVLLNKIDGTKANLTVSYINELINKKEEKKAEKPIVRTSPLSELSSTTIWISVAVLIALILAILAYFFFRRK